LSSPRSLHEATLAIVGLGLMGGSLALALRQTGACRRILGITRNPATRAQAVARGAVDKASGDLALVAEADVIVLATPVRTILEQLPRVGAMARQGAIVMDLGSTKRVITRAMEGLPAHVEPIGAHPMCGKERSGFNAADADLYRGAVFVLTPLARTSPEALACAEALATAVGARPLVLDPVRHDRIVALISHLPVAVACALMITADEFARVDEMVYPLAATGFRDTSRLAASDTTMMLDILMTNRDPVVQALRIYAQHLAELADRIAANDEVGLRDLLERAASKRRALSQAQRTAR